MPFKCLSSVLARELQCGWFLHGSIAPSEIEVDAMERRGGERGKRRGREVEISKTGTPEARHHEDNAISST